MTSESFLTFSLATFALALIPGPDNLFVMAQSSLYGKRAGVMITLGLCTGLIFHTLAVGLGIAALIATSALAFTTLKLCGAAYLFYLAWQAYQSSGVIDPDTINTLTDAQLYRRGIFMNITNPKVAIFFLAFLPQFINTDSQSMALQLLLLGAIFILITFIVFSTFAVLSASASTWLTRSRSKQVWLNRLAAAVFSVLALRLLVTTR